MDIKIKKLEEMLLDARSKVEDVDPFSIIGKEDQYTIIDVREPGEAQESGMVSGAHNIPRGLLEFQLKPAFQLPLTENQNQATVLVIFSYLEVQQDVPTQHPLFDPG